jgi:hypothetical protein
VRGICAIQASRIPPQQPTLNGCSTAVTLLRCKFLWGGASWPAEPGQAGPESSYLPSRATNHKSDIPPSRSCNMSLGMWLRPP